MTIVTQAAPSSPAATRLSQYALSTDTTPTMMSKDSSGNVRVMANIPGTTATYDLGTSSLKWRDAYLSRDVTIGGTVTLTTASSKIIPGATALLLRNNADSANNISITDAGDVTVRATITASTGLTVTSGSVSLPAASVDPSNINHTRVCWDSGTATVTASYANVTNGTERVDTAAINASGLTTFTAGTAGTYLVFASASFVLGSNYSAYLRIAKNGADAAGTEVQIGAIIPQAGTPIIMGSTQCIVTVANTDTISLQIKGDAGSSVIGATLLLIRVA